MSSGPFDRLRTMFAGRASTDGSFVFDAARLRELLDNLQSLALLLDTHGVVIHANPFLAEHLGCPVGELMGADWFQRIPEDVRTHTRARFEQAIRGAGPPPHDQHEVVAGDGERRLLLWDLTLLRDAEGAVAGMALVGIDVTARQREEARRRQDALHDPLTGLPSRSLFIDRLAGCMARTRRRVDYRFAALFLDIDRFKVVNDSLGHQQGDKLLVEVGQRLEKCLRPGDSVARLGGDEFALLIEDMNDPGVVHLVAERIQAALARPFALAGQEIFLTASIGTALNKPRYQGPEDFMRDADIAMHHAKAKGKARHEVFETSMHTRAKVLLQIENDLHRAVEREELSVHYQPIVSMKTGRVAGFEALLRWPRPGGGFIPPTDFVRIAEDTGLIIPLGAWVLRQACLQLREWQAHADPAHPPLMMSVNLSAKQFAQPDLVDQVGRIMSESALLPGTLKLEVTESILMQEPEAAAGMLAELRSQHVQICIDDFGTGYSSLSYLLRFPAHTLKIDRSFVSDMSAGRSQEEMVRTIVVLARNLGMDVIAEGVETEEQMSRLRSIDCDYAQGFLLSRAVDPAAAEQLLKDQPFTRLNAAGA